MGDPPNRIRAWRSARGWSLQRLAEACGTSKSQIDKLERGLRRLTVEWMVRLAKPLNCDPRDLLGMETIAHVTPTRHESSLCSVGLMLPVRGLVARGSAPDSGFHLTDHVVDEVPRPALLAHVKDAYAFYVLGSEMVPMYRPRQLLFVHPHKPPVPGNGVVLIAPDGATRIRAFVGVRTGGGLVTRLFHPRAREETFAPSTLAMVHTIVGSQEPC